LLMKRRLAYHHNPEPHRARSRAYLATHRLERRAFIRQDRATHPDRWHAYARKNYTKYHEKRLHQGRLYRSMHRQAMLIRSRAYDAQHRAARRAKARAYRLAYPETAIANNARRRARQHAAPINDLTAAEWKAIKHHYGYRCQYCGKKTRQLTRDHILALTQGGSHTVQNVIPACRPCNSKKYTGPPLVPVQPLLFALPLPHAFY